MTESTRHRLCKNCEHFWTESTATRPAGRSGQCRKKIYGLSEYGSAQFAKISENHWCGEWLPKNYNDNPAIKAAWDEFKTLHRLAMNYD